jgi:hypothetical protein
MTQREGWETVARKRVKSVSKIIGRGRDTAEVESTVRAMIVEQRLYSNKRGADFLRRPTNKKEKEAIKRVAKAARRLNVTLRHPALPSFVKKLFPPSQEKTTSDLEKLGLESLRKPRRYAPPHLPRRAAQYAVYLLQLHHLPVTTTRGGQAHKLAAAIYGTGRPDTFNHLRFYRDVQIYFEFDDLTWPK